MAFTGLQRFIDLLIERDEIIIIDEFVNPILEIAELTDRVVKSNGKALLFTNTGTKFPLLINIFGSEERMSMAMGRGSLEDAGDEMEKLFSGFDMQAGGYFSKLKMLPQLSKLASYMPVKKRGRGSCQQNIIHEADLNAIPVLKCWPHDGGSFITLPIVHTKHPESGEVNAGMYRMQIIDSKTTGMHWHRHKTGANHFEEWKKAGRKMPVAVALGGDPVYTYAATAPLPQGIDEYILAGFLRKKKVNMVKCISQDIYVPEDADFIIEGYVDPDENMIWEGPFGDHTGFYSLADWYPAFHVTCITHRNNAIYPATIVGIPPQEDTWIGLATEKLFLTPIKLSMQPEIIDFHMPSFGVAHNLVLVKINKSYPAQGIKTANSLFGAGQMMFSKYIIVMSSDIDLCDYEAVLLEIFRNTDFSQHINIFSGPLDILDHSSDTFSYGGKMGIDATVKSKEEYQKNYEFTKADSEKIIEELSHLPGIETIKAALISKNIPLLMLSISKDIFNMDDFARTVCSSENMIFIFLDKNVDMEDSNISIWQILSNTDPLRDIRLTGKSILIDATSKSHPSDNFPRDWPNVVVANEKTIQDVNILCEKLGLDKLSVSPSEKYRKMVLDGGASVISKT